MPKKKLLVSPLNPKQLSIKTTKCTADQEATGSGRLISTDRIDNFLMRIGLQKKKRGIFQILNGSTRECPLCKGQNSPSSKAKEVLTLMDVMRKNLNKKYLTTRESYNAKVVNDIVYNENTHIVSVFKDYLIYDDISEYMKRFYAAHESSTRLPKIYDFYDKYSKVFPNYIALSENKFMFKNIERKQRVIDEEQQNAEKQRKKPKKPDEDESIERNKVFTTLFLKDLNKPDNTLSRFVDNSIDENDKSESQLQSFLKKKAKKDISKTNGKPLKEMSLHKLVNKFIDKDSLSLIDITGAIKKVNEEKFELEENQTKPLQKVSSEALHKKSKSEVPPYPNSTIKALIDKKPTITIPMQRTELVSRIHSPIDQLNSRNADHLPATGVWSTLKGRMSSHRSSNEVQVKTLAGKAPIIITRHGSRAAASPTRKNDRNDLVPRSYSTSKPVPLAKSPNIFTWNGPDRSPTGKLPLSEFETYAYPITFSLKGAKFTSSQPNKGIPHNGVQQMRNDISPSRGKDASKRRTSSSSRPTNQLGYPKIVGMQEKAEIYGGRAGTELLAGGLNNVLVSTGTVKRKKNLVFEMEGLKGTKSVKSDQNKFKSKYLNELQIKHEKMHPVINERPNLEGCIAELAYSKSMGLLERTPGSGIASMRSTGFSQRPLPSRNGGMSTKNRRSGSYNKMQGATRSVKGGMF